MKKTSRNKRSISAESIARLADHGQDVSSFFTNKGKMMAPLRPKDRLTATLQNSDYVETVDRKLNQYQKSTRELMERLHRMNLVFEFFFVFSRFEHALTITNYLNESRGGVSPDWNKFAREVNDVFLAGVTPEVSKAIRYYEQRPPKKQIVDFDCLTWKDVVPDTAYELERLLLLVRRVRNNLFHGEKIGVLIEGDSERDAQLLTYGLTILYACLQSSSEIRQRFFSEMKTNLEEDYEIVA